MQGNSKEYKQGQYIFQEMSDNTPDYQKTDGFRKGAMDMPNSKKKDKKLVFIEPVNKTEQEAWLDKLIADISCLKKKEYADSC